MTEDNFQSEVLSGLAALKSDVAELKENHGFIAQALKLITERLEHHDLEFAAIKTQLRGVVARLDEQDASGDLMAKKLDRMNVQVVNSWEASEQALNALTTLSQRVVKLEHPDGHGDAAE